MIRLTLISLLVFAYSTASGQRKEKSVRYYRHTASCESLLKEENQLKLQNYFQDWDSIIFVEVGRKFSRKNGLHGIGFKNETLYKLEVFFKRDVDPDPFWSIDIWKVKSEKVKFESISCDIQKLDIDTLFTLRNDSLNLRSRGGVFTQSSHQPYSILLKISKEKLKFMYIYDAEYYQSTEPTEERRLFLNELNTLLTILKEEKN